MGIRYNKQSKVFSLDTDHSTYQIQVGPFGVLHHLYYGKKVEHTEMDYLIRTLGRGFSGNPEEARSTNVYSYDTLPLEYPTFGIGDYRSPCFNVCHADGSDIADLRYCSHSISEGKPKLQGLPATYGDDVTSLEITLADPVSNVRVKLLYSVFEKYDAITRSCIVTNGGKNNIYLKRVLSACLDFPDSGYDLITFPGRYAMERMVERAPLRHGKVSVDSIRGASSHQQNPFVILCDHNANEEYGDCFGLSLVYSGNFLASAEVDQVDQTRVIMGINPEEFSYLLTPDDSFTAPEVVLSYSAEGLTKLSHNYHKLYRKHLCRGKYQRTRRPVLINNWEATYFDFNNEKLLDIAKEASKVGIEMLVMDDGWFGKRENDQSSLGDWFVNTQKISGGLGKLVEQINALGMKFGIWFEPEMISEDSDLYRAHPDWCLHVPEHAPNVSRNQLVLDMSRSEIVDYLFDAMSKILKSANIEYVKWDMNRSLCDVWSAKLPADRQGETFHRYILGVYSLLERLTSTFPAILFEGCSGGGGRFDAGMLYYEPQIWCSDNTDPIDRLKIQYGTSFGYPVSAVGSHVSASPNHQNGRVTPFLTRGIVAMSGTFGYELDVCKLSDEEKQMMKEQIEAYKRNYDVFSSGDYYRLTNPFENNWYVAWQFVSEDKSKCVLNIVELYPKANPPLITLKLRGLDENKMYRVTGDKRVDPRVTDPIYSGSALMNAGLWMPVEIGDYIGYQYEIIEVK